MIKFYFNEFFKLFIIFIICFIVIYMLERYYFNKAEKISYFEKMSIFLRLTMVYLMFFTLSDKQIFNVVIIGLLFVIMLEFYLNRNKVFNYRYFEIFLYVIELFIVKGMIFITIVSVFLLILFLISIYLYRKLSLDINIYQLKITISEDIDFLYELEPIFKKYLKEFYLYSIRTSNMGTLIELRYDIVELQGINRKEFIDEIRIINSNLPISIIYK